MLTQLLRISRQLHGKSMNRFRPLVNEKDTWKHNAWDHVDWTEEQEQAALEKTRLQYEAPVPRERVEKHNTSPETFWDSFYNSNRENFFKPRTWIHREFPEHGEAKIVEIGCGTGSTMYPLLEFNENNALHYVATDYSRVALDVLRENAKFDGRVATPVEYDVTQPGLPAGVQEGSADVVFLVFVLSALSPEEWARAAANVARMLKPNGRLVLRDYGRYDLTQLRFKKERVLGRNFYVRGDGTRVYFFDESELKNIFGNTGLALDYIRTDRKLLLNRKRELKMYRVWIQGEWIRET